MDKIISIIDGLFFMAMVLGIISMLATILKVKRENYAFTQMDVYSFFISLAYVITYFAKGF